MYTVKIILFLVLLVLTWSYYLFRDKKGSKEGMYREIFQDPEDKKDDD